MTPYDLIGLGGYKVHPPDRFYTTTWAQTSAHAILDTSYEPPHTALCAICCAAAR